MSIVASPGPEPRGDSAPNLEQLLNRSLCAPVETSRPYHLYDCEIDIWVWGVRGDTLLHCIPAPSSQGQTLRPDQLCKWWVLFDAGSPRASGTPRQSAGYPLLRSKIKDFTHSPSPPSPKANQSPLVKSLKFFFSQGKKKVKSLNFSHGK